MSNENETKAAEAGTIAKKELPLAAKIGIGVGAAVVLGAVVTGVVLFVRSKAAGGEMPVVDTAD